MSAGSFTPGPWRVDGTRIRDCRPGVDAIATMQVSNQPNWEDDARLISAAPELMKAVEDCEHYLTSMQRTFEEMCLPIDNLSAPLRAARAAISKATGDAS